MPNEVTALREALKAKGWNRSKVSVRVEHSTVRVTIRDLSVPFAAVHAVATKLERIDRDQATGEILSGGNTFVSVDYADEVIEPVKAKYRAICEALVVGGESVVDGIEIWRDAVHSYRLHRIEADGSRSMIVGGHGWMSPYEAAYGIIGATLKRGVR